MPRELVALLHGHDQTLCDGYLSAHVPQLTHNSAEALVGGVTTWVFTVPNVVTSTFCHKGEGYFVADRKFCWIVVVCLHLGIGVYRKRNIYKERILS